MERDVYRVALDGHEVPDAASRAALVESSHAASGAMYFAKLDSLNVEALRVLGSVGFYVVDATVTLATSGAGATVDAAVSVCEATPAMYDDILNVAGSAFRYSRFHLDPQVPSALAHRIKREWIASYTRKERGALLLAGAVDGRTAGFLAVLDQQIDGRRVRTIDLIGVDAAYQGRGVGTALTRYFVNAYARDFDVLQVGTQAANVPSLRMYMKCGFIPTSTRYVVHLHVPART